MEAESGSKVLLQFAFACALAVVPKVHESNAITRSHARVSNIAVGIVVAVAEVSPTRHGDWVQ